MAQNTVNAINAASVNVEKKEVTVMMNNMTAKELKAMAKDLGVKGYSKMNKADLIAVLAPTAPTTVEVSVGDLSITKDTMEVVEVKVKEEVSDMKAKYNAAVWDKLVKALASEYVKQSLGVKWALFYKNSKSTVTKSEYLVKSSRLWGATSKVIKALYGEKNCSESTIQQALNAMTARGYLNYQRIHGKNGTNVIFNASAEQMNAMWKLSK